jgi:hypothetical protein
VPEVRGEATVTKTQAWNHTLRREIAEQQALIKRMDMHIDNGIMAGIRAERLDLLEQLLRFEPEDQRGPLPDEPGAPQCPCGTPLVRVEGGYVPACDCVARNRVSLNREAPHD